MFFGSCATNRYSFGRLNRAIEARQCASRSAAELDAHCLAAIARFKRPKEYRFVQELPKNNYGKVLKTELRALLGCD